MISKKLERKIAEQQQRIAMLETQLAEAKAYLAGLQDSVTLSARGAPLTPSLRPGSDLARVRDILQKEGKPLRIDELLKRLGKKVDRNSKGALAGSLGSYFRRGTVFSRPSPNVYGLMEFENSADEPPEDFGLALPVRAPGRR